MQLLSLLFSWRTVFFLIVWTFSFLLWSTLLIKYLQHLWDACSVGGQWLLAQGSQSSLFWVIVFKTFPWKTKALSRKLRGETSVSWHLNLVLDRFENYLCFRSLKEGRKILKSHRSRGIKDFIVLFFSSSDCVSLLLGER